LTRHVEVVTSLELRAARSIALRGCRLTSAMCQVRNVGTIGGNVASPTAAETTPRAHRFSCDGDAWARAAQRVVKVDTSSRITAYRRSTALLLWFDLPPMPQDARGGYWEMTRQVNDIPLVNLGLVVAGDPVRTASVAVGGLARTPGRLACVEHALVGSRLDASGIDHAVAAMRKEKLDPIPDQHGPAEYRMRMGGVLLRRALQAHSDQPPTREQHHAA
jgi:carbon-monoxide dehydrogenase medium subunit